MPTRVAAGDGGEALSGGDNWVGWPRVVAPEGFASAWHTACGLSCGTLVAVNPRHYPRHFRALTGYHRDLKHLDRREPTPTLQWNRAVEYFTAHASAHNATLT